MSNKQTSDEKIENAIEPEITRSKRKTLSLEVKRDGKVIVRAPLRISMKEIQAFIDKHEGWIEKQLQKIAETPKEDILSLSDNEIRILSEDAKKYIPGKVAYYAEKIGVTYGRITIKHQKTRWGSCSSNIITKEDRSCHLLTQKQM